MAKYNYGEIALQSFLNEKNRQTEEARFNQQFAQTERQNSLMNQINQAKLAFQERQLAAQSTTVSKGDTFNQLGVPVGTYPNSLIDNILSIKNPKPVNQPGFTLGPGQTRYSATGEPIASVAPKPESTTATTNKTIDDLANLQGVITNIEGLNRIPVDPEAGKNYGILGIDALSEDDPEAGQYRQYKGKFYNQQQFRSEIINPQKVKGKVYAQKLIRRNQLNDAVNIIKDYRKEGLDLNTSLQYFKEDNPDLSENDEQILASYFYLEDL